MWILPNNNFCPIPRTGVEPSSLMSKYRHKFLTTRTKLRTCHPPNVCTKAPRVDLFFFVNMFWLIAIPFGEKECVWKRTNIWYEPSDLSITFKALLYRFIMRRSRWNYDQLLLASSIYFTTSSRPFLPDYGLLSVKQVEITKFHRWFCAYERNNISRNVADVSFFSALCFFTKWKWAQQKKTNKSIVPNRGNKMICN